MSPYLGASDDAWPLHRESCHPLSTENLRFATCGLINRESAAIGLELA